VVQHLPHDGRERRAGKVAARDKAASLRRCGALRLGVEADIGAIDEKLEMEMGEAVLNHARQLAPNGLERGVIA
jgi:hypothetical protein